MNVNITNKGSGAAFSLKSDGLEKSSLPAGSTWSYISNSTSRSLAQTIASISFAATWQDANGVAHNTTTNTVNTALSLAAPGTPGLSLSKNIGTPSGNQINVTLTLSSTTVRTLSAVSFQDPIPAGMTFAKSYNESSLIYNSGVVSGNVSSIPYQTPKVFL
ncbi:MAG: hypothetical protein ACREBS_03810, partial [Nitrososphaerales archaeon]